MTTQTFDFKFASDTATIEVHCYNDDVWANEQDLMEVIGKLLRCSDNWKTFSVIVESKESP
jgi:hypothetical protein